MLVAAALTVALLTVAAQVWCNRTYPGQKRGPVRLLSSAASALERAFAAAGRFLATYLNVFEWVRTRLFKDVAVAVADIALPLWRIASSWLYAGRELAYKNFWLSTSALVAASAWCLAPHVLARASLLMGTVCAVSHARRLLFGDNKAAMLGSALVALAAAYALLWVGPVDGLSPLELDHDSLQSFPALLSLLLPVATMFFTAWGVRVLVDLSPMAE